MPSSSTLVSRQSRAEAKRIVAEQLTRGAISYTMDRFCRPNVMMHLGPMLLDHAIVPILVTIDRDGRDVRNDGGRMALLREPMWALSFPDRAGDRLYNHFKTVGDIWRWVSPARARAEDRVPETLMPKPEVSSFRMQLRELGLPC